MLQAQNFAVIRRVIYRCTSRQTFRMLLRMSPLACLRHPYSTNHDSSLHPNPNLNIIPFMALCPHSSFIRSKHMMHLRYSRPSRTILQFTWTTTKPCKACDSCQWPISWPSIASSSGSSTWSIRVSYMTILLFLKKLWIWWRNMIHTCWVLCDGRLQIKLFTNFKE